MLGALGRSPRPEGCVRLPFLSVGCVWGACGGCVVCVNAEMGPKLRIGTSSSTPPLHPPPIG